MGCGGFVGCGVGWFEDAGLDWLAKMGWSDGRRICRY